MKKVTILGALALLASVASAQAAPNYVPAPPPKPKPHHPSKPHHPAAPTKTHRCQPHRVGYNATGTLVSAALTPEGHRRYSGTLVVDVTKANHRAPKGEETFTLNGARVVFHHGVDSAAPAPGSRVKLHGKTTALAKRCPSEGFTPTVTLRKVDIAQPRHPKR